MRMKHGSGRGPTISVKPRLLAAFAAVAMMFATAVPALLPQTAQAAAALADGSKCTPQGVTIGSFEEDFRNPDVGIATYVDGNMFMGKPNNPATTSYGASPSQTAEQGNFSPSYAVEAEGTTLVAGKVINGNIKKSWGGIGFRFGTVGFGANYRPAANSTVLAVGGGGKLTLTARDDRATSFLAYGTVNNGNTTGAGWAGYYKSKDQTTGPNYNMQINGLDAWPSVSGTSSKALFASNPGGGLANSTITFDDRNALSNVHIVGATRTDYSNFGTEIQNDSKLMGQQKTPAQPAARPRNTPLKAKSGSRRRPAREASPAMASSRRNMRNTIRLSATSSSMAVRLLRPISSSRSSATKERGTAPLRSLKSLDLNWRTAIISVLRSTSPTFRTMRALS